MLKNFNEVKGQLNELAEIVNRFKSEAVQLRIVELIFRNHRATETENIDGTDEVPKSSPKTLDKRSKAASKNPQTAATRKAKASAGNGPKAVVEQLIKEGYFKTPRKISDIVEQCRTQKARIFTTGDLSPTLGRLIKARALARKKNDEGQYEYYV